jgi:hypothetical protein
MLARAALFGIALFMVGGGSAWAGVFPRNVIGTWEIINGQAHDTLVISSQADTGRRCESLSGNLINDAGSNPVTGFYCPPTGRIVFVRLRTTGAVYQVYSGNLAEKGTIYRMAGTFADFSVDDLAEYGWSASK